MNINVHTQTRLTDDNCPSCGLFSFCKQSKMSLVTSRRYLKAQETLYSYHDAFHSIYTVSSGAVKTVHIDLEGNQHIQQFYFQGEILGFDAIYPNHHPFSAITVTASEICKIPYSTLMDFIASNHQFYTQFISKISQRFNFGLYVNSYSAEQRLACFLLELIKRLNVDRANLEFDIMMSRQDIGHYLGLATETISRVLTRFQQRNIIIITSHKKMKISDMNALQWIAQDGNLMQEN